MALRYYTNAPVTSLSAPATSVDSTITVTSASAFPISYPYTLILDRGQSTEEVVLVTAAAGSVLTVTRGYDSTTAYAHALGAEVAHGIAAIDPREANSHVNATANVHGVGASSSVVGTATTQTLTNKTLGNTNTLNGFTASKMAVTDGSGKLVAGTSAIPTGAVVGDSDTQTLTNKTLGSTNTINGFTADRFMQSDSTGKLTHSTKALPTGAVVGTTDTQTLSNKTLSSSDLSSTSNQVGTHVAFVGELRMTAAATAESGWLICNGAAVSRTTYSALFAKIGTAFGVGDGSSTFNLPDFRDRFPTGAGGSKSFAAQGGSATRVLTSANLPPHSHTLPIQYATSTTATGTATRVTDVDNQTGGTGTAATATTSNGPGSSTPVDILNPWLAVNFVIKF